MDEPPSSAILTRGERAEREAAATSNKLAAKDAANRHIQLWAYADGALQRLPLRYHRQRPWDSRTDAKRVRPADAAPRHTRRCTARLRACFLGDILKKKEERKFPPSR